MAGTRSMHCGKLFIMYSGMTFMEHMGCFLYAEFHKIFWYE